MSIKAQIQAMAEDSIDPEEFTKLVLDDTKIESISLEDMDYLN